MRPASLLLILVNYFLGCAIAAEHAQYFQHDILEGCQHNEEYDIIVAGLGTSSAILVPNLAERFPNLSILVLEAGPPLSSDVGGTNRPPYIKKANGTDTYFDIPAEYSSLAYKGLGKLYRDKNVPFSFQGTGWGGNSQFNGMWVQIPSLEEFDKNWPSGWKKKDVEEYFNKLLDKSDIVSDSSKGSRGDRLQSAYDISTKIFRRLNATLKPAFRVYKSSFDEYSPPYVISKGGRRSGPVSDWLVPLLEKKPKKLSIISFANVEKVIFSNNDGHLEKSTDLSAVGVKYWKRDRLKDKNFGFAGLPCYAFLKPGGRVILSAGALKSPHILYMSGLAHDRDTFDKIFKSYIGKKPLYRGSVPNLGIVFDHIGSSLVIQDKSKLFQSFRSSDYRLNKEDLNLYVSSHAGPYSVYGPIQSLRMRANTKSAEKADVEVFVIPTGVGRDHGPFSGPHDFSMFFQLLNTTARHLISFDNKTGFLKLEPLPETSARGLDDDLRLASGVWRILQVIKDLPQLEIVLGPGGISHPELDPSNLTDVREFVKGLKNPYKGEIYFTNLLMNHFGGSVALGKSLEPRTMLVRGTSNVHVVDGSCVPQPIEAHPIFTIMMLAEKASDLISDEIMNSLRYHQQTEDDLTRKLKIIQ